MMKKLAFTTLSLAILASLIWWKESTVSFRADRSPASSQKIILLALEGLSYDEFLKARDEKLFSEFAQASQVIAPFPSQTDYAWNVFTQAQKVHGKRGKILSPEASYFDSPTQTVINDARDFFRRQSEPALYMGAFDHTVTPYISSLMGLTLSKFESEALLNLKKKIMASFEDDIISSFLVVPQGTNEKQKFLSSLDGLIKEIRQSGVELGYNPQFILVSAHGNLTAKKTMDLNFKSFLETQGLALKEKLIGPKDVGIPSFAPSSVAGLYFKDLSHRGAIVEALKKEPFFELGIYLIDKTPEKTTLGIFDSQGMSELIIYGYGPQPLYFYKASGEANPLQIPSRFTGTVISDDLAFRVTGESPYPDSFARLAKFSKEDEFSMPDLLVVLKDDYLTPTKETLPLHYAGGSLRKNDSLGFVASDYLGNLPSSIRVENVLSELQVPAKKLFKSGEAGLASNPQVVLEEAPLLRESLKSEGLQLEAVLTNPYPLNNFIHYSRYVLELPSLESLFKLYKAPIEKRIVDEVVAFQDFDFKKVKHQSTLDIKEMNKSQKKKTSESTTLRMVASIKDRKEEESILQKNYTSFYVMEKALAQPDFMSLIDTRDLKHAALWNTQRDELTKDYKKLKEESKELFHQVFAERLLAYNMKPAELPLYYNRLTEDKDDITVVYVPGIYNAIFEGRIFTMGLDGLKNRFGVRIISPPVYSTCSSKYNGEVILKFIKDDMEYRKLRQQKKQRYFIFGYSKGGIDSLNAFTLDPEFTKKEIAGLLTIASPLHGAAILKRSDVPLPVFDILTSEDIPEVCRKQEKASHSITPEAMENFYRTKMGTLKDLTRYYSISFVSDAKKAHYWMKATKAIAFYKEDNDGVVTLSSSHFPEELKALDLGTVNADHLAGLIETSFPQEAFMEAIYMTLLELKAFDPQTAKYWSKQ